jgi:DNA-binding NtrC family response regulator
VRPPLEWALPDRGLDLDEVLASVERTLIRQALDRTSGNKRQAAELLGLKRTTLVEKLKRLGPEGQPAVATAD